MRKHLLIFALYLSVVAQAETYNFARLDNTHGLSNKQVKGILKDVCQRSGLPGGFQLSQIFP